MAFQSKTKFRLGPWTIHPDRLVLSDETQEVRVHYRNMQVLLALVEAQGEVVTKEEFFEIVWGNTVVTESSLNRAISVLRKILDQESEQSFIETIPKKGYRLTQIPQVIKATRSNTFLRQIYLMLLVVLGVTLTMLLLQKGYHRTKVSPSLSPSGNKIAYFMKTDSGYSLYTEDFMQKSVNLLAHGLNPESFAIAWSPNSEYVVYNATQSIEPFFAINIQSTKEDSPLFIKFAKDDRKHQTESIPENLDSPIKFISHKELTMNEDRIHHIYLGEKGIVKVYFDENIIESFGW